MILELLMVVAEDKGNGARVRMQRPGGPGEHYGYRD